MDIAELLARPHDMNVGDAARYLEGFAAEMACVGYSPLTIGGYLDSVIHFGGWLKARGLSLAAVDEKVVKAFGAHRCKCPGRRSYLTVSRAYIARVERFVRYIGQQGVIRLTVNSVPEVPTALIAFREWLLRHRGLAPITVDRHERLLKQMLPALGADTSQYTAATVRVAILEQIRGRRPAYAKTFVGALRIYLRFMATHLFALLEPGPGLCDLLQSCDIDLGVVRGWWKGATVPDLAGLSRVLCEFIIENLKLSACPPHESRTPGIANAKPY